MAQYVDIDAQIEFEPVKGWKETHTIREIADINHGSLPVADVVARDCYDRLLAENDRLRKERPVVRCKDCKHYDCEDGDQKCVKDAEWVEEYAGYYGFISYHEPEFFCAWGERKEGEKDEC